MLIEDKLEKKILKKYKKAKKIEKLISLEKNEIQKLGIIKFLASYYSSNVTGVYYSEFLERELIKISNEMKFNKVLNEEKNSVIHIMTCSYDVGGHTRVVDNWINFDENKSHSVLINDPQNSVIPSWLKETIKKSGGELIYNNKESDYDKAKYLYDKASLYETIILHIHNDDVIPMLAFSNKDWRKKIYFYNHSDHKFWLGINISDEVLELSKDGLVMSQEKRGNKKREVLSIPITENEYLIEESNIKDKNLKEILGISEESKVVLSMASAYKYKKINSYDFCEFLKEVIKIDNTINIIVIGPNKNDKRWKAIEKESNGRIRAVGIVDKATVKDYMEIADVYIDSFPLNSYTCLLEALSYKIPIFSLKTPISDLDSIKSIKYLKQEEIINEIKKVFNNDNNLNYIDLLNKVRGSHYKDNWLEVLKSITLNKSNRKKTITEQPKYQITNYERFMFEITEENIFPIRRIKGLSVKNKILIILICRKEFFSLIPKIIKKIKKINLSN